MTIEGFVLVGGRSLRMGRDKARLVLDGTPLVVRAARLLAPFVEKVTFLGPPDRYGDLGFPVLADSSPDLGPLGALCTGLLHSKAAWNIFLACDLPLLTDRLVELLVSRARASGSDAVVPQTADGWQPLCAAYRPRCLDKLKAALRAGKLSVRSALDELDVDALTRAQLAAAGIRPEEFANVNTPEEWDDIKSSRSGRR
jgi:molybdopterin-guanine dinucleotide biosynthesis protein A